uniref:Uncharacterized protein n=1 Tax=viral metagenome TaxID=1070528 RepID=A0A6M3XKJ4_9ZZZZ
MMQTMTMIETCPWCGSAACLAQSEEFCRHTRMPRTAAFQNPPLDKMVHQPEVAKRVMRRKRNKGR